MRGCLPCNARLVNYRRNQSSFCIPLDAFYRFSCEKISPLQHKIDHPALAANWNYHAHLRRGHYVGAVSLCLRPWVGPDWTLRVSLRAAFYVMGTLISWLLLVTAVADLARLHSGNNAMPSIIYKGVLIPTIFALIWIYAGFLSGSGTVSRRKSFALAVAIFGLLIALMVGIDLIIRL